MSEAKKLIDLLKEDLLSRKVEVEVLGQIVVVTPMTVGDQTRVNALHPDDGALRLAEILVSKCHDAQGNPVFDKSDKQALKRAVAGDRLGPVIAAITGPPAEAQLKN
jgi:hypothetical protein